MIYPESSISHCSLVSVSQSVGGVGVQPFSQVWGRREVCQKTTRIFPTYMFLLFLFREASSSSARSVPLICGENTDTMLSGYPGAAAQVQNTGLQQPASSLLLPSAPSMTELPDQAVGFFLVCGEKQRDSCHWEQSITFRRPGWQVNRDPD